MVTPDYTRVLWDASGKPYWQNTDGSKTYIAPIAAAQYANPTSAGYDPKLAAWAKSMGAEVNYNNPSQPQMVSTGSPESGFAKAPSTWNPQTGQWDAGNFLDSSLGGLILGGSAVAAPLALSALASPTAAAAASANAGVDAGEGGLGLVGAAPAAGAAVPAASTAAAGSTAATIANLLKVGAPITAAITNRLGQPSGAGSGVSSLDPALMARLSSLLDMAQQRVASAQPVHDAAMSMAMRMAPTYADSPRLTQAIQNSTTPAPTGNYSAATLAALKKMAGQ